jgi:50S ribosomal protein L16 3-hydroxylase
MASESERVPLASALGTELRALLAPVSPETFVSEYWGQKPLFVKGFPGKYAGFFDREAFVKVLSGPPAPPEFLHASFDKSGTDPVLGATGAPKDMPATVFAANIDQAGALYAGGATLCATQVESRMPSLAPFVAAIKRQLGYPGKVTFNAYLSPAGSGFNWHFDMRVATTLQIDGTKRWRFSNRPCVAWPQANGVLRTDRSGRYVDAKVGAETWANLAPFDEKDVTEVMLEPGDLLVLPAGTWHDACGGATGSLALNLSFTPVSYAVLLRDLLESMLSADPEWRGPPPLLPSIAGRPGEVDAGTLAAIGRQLSRAAEALGSVSADSAAVVRLWTSFVQNVNPQNIHPSGAAGAARAVEPIVAGDKLRIRSDGNVYVRTADQGTKLFVSVGANGLALTGTAMRFVQRVLSAREFVAGDSVDWGDDARPLTWREVEATLNHLLREGLLERAR